MSWYFRTFPSRASGWADCLAGLPVALLALPQAMAYALVAHLPISTGLFAAIFATMIAARFGNSKFLILGPTNTVAILLQSGTSQILFTHYQGLSASEQQAVAIGIMAHITLVVGVLQLLASAFKLGKLTQFVSRSVIVGYLTAAALTLAINQLFPFFGIDSLGGYHSLVGKLKYIITHWRAIHLPTLGFGLGCLGLLVLLNRHVPSHYPRAAVMLGVATIGVFIWTTDAGHPPTALIESYGGIDRWIPSIHIPAISLRMINAIFPTAVAIALLGILEVSSLLKSVKSADQEGEVDRDVFGLGMANLGAMIFGAMPVSASPSRTVLNATSGAKSSWAAVWSGVWLLGMVGVLGPIIAHIPLAALSALLILMAATRVVDKRQLQACFNATQADRAVLLVTTVSALFLSLPIAFFIGILVSVTFYLKEAARPVVTESQPESSVLAPDPRIRLVEVEGELFFGAAEHLNAHLHDIARDEEAEVIILQLRNARHLDATGCLIIERMAEKLKKEGRSLMACEVPSHVWSVIERAGTVRRWGDENLFRCDLRDPSSSIHHAIRRAKRQLSTTKG